MAQTRPDTEVIFDPRTYAQGVPHEVFDRLRRQTLETHAGADTEPVTVPADREEDRS